MMADPSADPGEGIVFLEQFKGLPVFARIDQRDKSLGTDVRGACGPTGCGAPLGNGECAGNRLSVSFVYRFAVGKPLVVFVGNVNGTDLGTLSTAGAFGKIHQAGLLADPGQEISGIALQINEFGIGKKFDVQMPADLDQFR